MRGAGACFCGDSVRSVIGTCPGRGHREYHMCPARQGLGPWDFPRPSTPEPEVTTDPEQVPGQLLMF